jgi:tRNA-splicing ligase RtcB (3'-phosphate/5'-hydroxy nucleic acid ligase)
MTYELIDNGGAAVPIKAWTRGVPVEDGAKEQLRRTAALPIVWPHVAVMPDVHFGIGSTVGSVIPTVGAIIPAAVSVDIGCGMVAARTSLTSHDLGDNAKALFESISKSVPAGRTHDGGPNDRGAWSDAPEDVRNEWGRMLPGFKRLVDRHARLETGRQMNQLGTLGTGNHFIEVCLDKQDHVWVMLHSGSRGIGNRIGSHFIALAQQDMAAQGIQIADRDLAYLTEGAEHFYEYVEAVSWAQDYARTNRNLMLAYTLRAMRESGLPKFELTEEAINCHHNYVQKETHFGRELYLTRKGAVSARLGELGIIPGSMGTRSFIVRGLGNAESFHTCSHGAGRVMSRGEASRTITLEQHRADTAHVVCSKDRDVLDESPRAYKDIDAVMAAQSDLVEIVYELTQIVCVKGLSDGDSKRDQRKAKKEAKRAQSKADRREGKALAQQTDGDD